LETDFLLVHAMRFQWLTEDRGTLLRKLLPACTEPFCILERLGTR
jgi:hypothetical protein